MARQQTERARWKTLRAEIMRKNAVEKRLGCQLAALERDRQRLLDELQALCTHARVYEFSGELVTDFGDVLLDRPMRVCAGCNLIEIDRYVKLTAAPAVKTSYARMGAFHVMGVSLG